MPKISSAHLLVEVLGQFGPQAPLYAYALALTVIGKSNPLGARSLALGIGTFVASGPQLACGNLGRPTRD